MHTNETNVQEPDCVVSHYNITNMNELTNSPKHTANGIEIQSFNALIEKSIIDHWTLDALTDYQGTTLQYHDVARKIEKLHILFENSGVEKGDKLTGCYQYQQTDDQSAEVEEQNHPNIDFYWNRIHIIYFGVKLHQTCIML